MLLYLDNCMFNRPFDVQDAIRVRLETIAKLAIQQGIRDKHYQLVWSFMLDMENSQNPFAERRMAIGVWRTRATIEILPNESIRHNAMIISGLGIHTKDALHVVCALEAGADYFITTDHRILKRMRQEQRIKTVSPINFLEWINDNDDGN
ncbi:PIN domain protein [Ectothiorhodospiraceae bacterium BW-2]|nr:PIN domain protein [Ectothiorhodospiraceae bacterium BW-2]